VKRLGCAKSKPRFTTELTKKQAIPTIRQGNLNFDKVSSAKVKKFGYLPKQPLIQEDHSKISLAMIKTLRFYLDSALYNRHQFCIEEQKKSIFVVINEQKM